MDDGGFWGVHRANGSGVDACGIGRFVPVVVAVQDGLLAVEGAERVGQCAGDSVLGHRRASARNEQLFGVALQHKAGNHLVVAACAGVGAAADVDEAAARVKRIQVIDADQTDARATCHALHNDGVSARLQRDQQSRFLWMSRRNAAGADGGGVVCAFPIVVAGKRR